MKGMISCLSTRGNERIGVEGDGDSTTGHTRLPYIPILLPIGGTNTLSLVWKVHKWAFGGQILNLCDVMTRSADLARELRGDGLLS